MVEGFAAPFLGRAGCDDGLEVAVEARGEGQDAAKSPNPPHMRHRPALNRCSLVGSEEGLGLDGPFSTTALWG